VLPGGGYSSDNTADGDASSIIVRPMLVDALHSMRITQVSTDAILFSILLDSTACSQFSVQSLQGCHLLLVLHAVQTNSYEVSKSVRYSRSEPASTAAVKAQLLLPHSAGCTPCDRLIHTLC
jgi:hypothetical protein